MDNRKSSRAAAEGREQVQKESYGVQPLQEFSANNLAAFVEQVEPVVRSFGYPEMLDTLRCYR